MPSLATNSANTLKLTIRNSAGTLVDPVTITLHWKLGRDGIETTIAKASLTRVSTGIYTYEITPEDDGEHVGDNVLIYYEWVTTVPAYVERGRFAMSTSQFTYAR